MKNKLRYYMILSYIVGCISIVASVGFVQDFLGLENYKNYLDKHWVNIPYMWWVSIFVIFNVIFGFMLFYAGRDNK